MKYSRGLIEFSNGLIINWWQEWTQFFNIKKFNWCDFSIINIGFEYDRMCGGVEIMFIILGLAIRLRIPIKTDKSDETWNKINSPLSEIKQYFRGYAKEKDIIDFKKRKVNYIRLYRRKEDCPKTIKKLFIQ